VIIALIGGVAFGAYRMHSEEKAEEQTFATARQVALDAPRSAFIAKKSITKASLLKAVLKRVLLL